MIFNVAEFLTDYGIQYWTEGNNVQRGWINIRCPSCGDDSNHGGFNLAKGYYNCWMCGHKELESIVCLLAGVSYIEAQDIIREYSGRNSLLKLLNKKENKKQVDKIELPGDELQEIHKKYLRKRNFNPNHLINKYKIKGTGIIGYWKYRIIIPIIYKNKIVSFQGRDITDKQKNRYITLSKDESIINPKTILYNLDNCKRDIIGVVEGVFDVWRFGSNFAATLGTIIKKEQLRLLKNYKKVFFLFDPESEALKKAEKAAIWLNQYKVEVEIIELDNCDPGDFSFNEAKEMKKEIGI